MEVVDPFLLTRFCRWIWESNHPEMDEQQCHQESGGVQGCKHPALLGKFKSGIMRGEHFITAQTLIFTFSGIHLNSYLGKIQTDLLKKIVGKQLFAPLRNTR
jgi:hypothetical protein